MFEITEIPFWTVIEGELEFTPAEHYRLAEIIPQKIIQRILDQVDANEDPLPINSERWLRIKRRLGAPQQSLRFQDRLSNISYWEIKITDYGMMEIQLNPEMKEIHRELIELSNETGKRYDLFFGVNEEDAQDVQDSAWLLQQEKLRRYQD
jgi:hypothetical protein